MTTDNGNVRVKAFFWIGVAGLFAFLPHLPGQSLQIVTSSLPNGSVGVAYSQPIAVTGGTCSKTGVATSSIDAGALPAGLSVISPAGVEQWTIQGAPTAGGTFQFTLHVVWTHNGVVPPSPFDLSCTDNATKALSITVVPASGCLLYTSPSPRD